MLAQLEGDGAAGPKKITDPALLRQLDPSSLGGDIVKSLGQGVAEGAAGLIELPQTLAKLGATAATRGAEAVRGFIGLPFSEEEKAAAERVRNVELPRPATAVREGLGITYEPQTTPGKYAKTVGEALPGALAGPGGMVRNVITQGILPGLASEAAGQATEGSAFEPYARAGAAILGGFTAPAAQRAVSPFRASSPTRQAAVDALRHEGVTDITAGQATGSKGLQYFESTMGGGRGADMLENQGEQFSRAVLRRVGEDAPRATPEVLDRAFTRIGQQFDDLAARNTVPLDAQAQNALLNAATEYQQLVPQAAPAVENIMNRISTMAAQNGGRLDGATYQASRSQIDRMARNSGDPQLSHALREMREALDDAMERGISPQDAAAWREARNQYRNMIVVEQAATGAGENAAQGLISPSGLRNATVAKHGRRNYARGDGDFAELARSGEAVLKPLPNSGTAPRLLSALGPSVSGAVGGVLGSGFGPAGTVAGALAGSAVPAAVGRATMSRPVQAYLRNQVAAGANLGDDAQRAAIVQALMQAQRFSGR